MQEKNRFRLVVEYDGTGLVGWQAQNGQCSVQSALQKALQSVTGEDVEVFGSGRTDAGVHAFAQVVHLDVDKKWEPFRLKEAMNYYLRQDGEMPIAGQVAVLDAEIAAAEFNARFDAVKRHYLYRIINRREHLALEKNRAWQVIEELDADKMHNAAALLIGNHDFTSFRSTECQSKSPIKTLDKIDISRYGDTVEFNIAARSFLHHQVRNIVGTLRLIGNGKWREKDLANALAAKDRRAAGEKAPAYGLYLVKVDY